MEFLIFGTFWFWSLSAIAWILITVAEEKGYYFRATFVLLGFLALYYLFGGEEPMHLLIGILHNPIGVVLAVLGYLFVGTSWGIIKWFFFVLKERDRAMDRINRKLNVLSTPQASENKERIITWMVYWPFSMLWTLINDPVRRAFEWIYRRIGKFMQSMSDRMFKKVFQEQENQKKAKEEEALQKRKERLGHLSSK